MEVVAHPLSRDDRRITIIPRRGDFAVVYAGVSFVGDQRVRTAIRILRS